MRIMGLDVGSHTIGVAISDELRITAQSLKTIRRRSKKADFEEIKRIINQFQIEKIVVGLPKNMNGTLGKQAAMVLQWIKDLKQNVSLPVETWDERLSTVEASKVLLEADVSRTKRRKAVDKLAAVIILQGHIDRSKNPDDNIPS
ncbi:MAG: Holliday junction resolvase RuvX [Thermodesulfobacteriota bacterium]